MPRSAKSSALRPKSQMPVLVRSIGQTSLLKPRDRNVRACYSEARHEIHADSAVPHGGNMQAHRPTIMGTRHMVAACQYLAAEAGFRILEAGGNAIDAGVAGGIALGVVQPEYVNFAGVAPIIIYSAADNRVFTIPGLGTWPEAIARDHFKKHHGGKIPQGILRTVVPAAPDAWITALERFGTMSFG